MPTDIAHPNFHQLVERFHNFREEFLLAEHAFFDRLAHGQNPRTLVIACCDSRADPAILLGCRPGELFVVRSIAALVPGADKAGNPDAVIAAVEYAVKHLSVENIIVMGHSNCGGIHGALFPEKIEEELWISRWVALASPVIAELVEAFPEEDPHEQTRRAEEGAILLSIENLLSYDWVHERVEAGTLHLHALYYDIAGKSLNVWNSEVEDFEPHVL